MNINDKAFMVIKINGLYYRKDWFKEKTVIAVRKEPKFIFIDDKICHILSYNKFEVGEVGFLIDYVENENFKLIAMTDNNYRRRVKAFDYIDIEYHKPIQSDVLYNSNKETALVYNYGFEYRIITEDSTLENIKNIMNLNQPIMYTGDEYDLSMLISVNTNQLCKGQNKPYLIVLSCLIDGNNNNISQHFIHAAEGDFITIDTGVSYIVYQGELHRVKLSNEVTDKTINAMFDGVDISLNTSKLHNFIFTGSQVNIVPL